MKVKCGIYKITNLVNNKVYIGQSVDIKERWSEHRRALNLNKHSSQHFQRSWNKYGFANFVFEIIEECEKEKLTEREQFWIDYYGGINSEQLYNYRDAGSSGTFSEEVKQKLSLSHLGKRKGEPIPWLQNFDYTNPEFRQRISESLTGKKKSKSHAEHISEGRKGIVFSEEQKQKISKSKKGVSTSLKGCKKFKKDNVIKWVKPEEFEKYLKEGWEQYHDFYAGENYQRISSWNKGVPCTEEQKENLRQKNLGKKLSDETKKKMSESRKGMIWINNGIKNTRIKKDELDNFLSLGWVKGKIRVNV